MLSTTNGDRTRRRGMWWKAGGVVAAIALVISLSGASTASTAPAAGNEPEVGVAKFDRGFSHGEVPVDGSVLHYVKGGSGPVLVLLHGWPQNWWTWHQVMPELAKNHTVIAFDLPGLGKSTVPSDGFDKVTTAKRIRQAVNRLGYTKINIMGHDMGAAVAYRYARDFPAEVGRIAVLDLPLPGFGLEQVLGPGWPFQLNFMPAPTPEKIIDDDDVRTYHGFVLTAGAWHPERVDMEAAFKAYAKAENRHAGYEYTRAFPADATANKADLDANRLKLPVLVAFGQFGVETDVPAWYRQVADDVRSASVPDAGHFLSEENPQFLAACTTQFFGGPVTPGLPAGCNA